MAQPDWLTFLCPQAGAIRGPICAPATASRYHTRAQWQATSPRALRPRSGLDAWLLDLHRLRWPLQPEIFGTEHSF